MKKTYLIIGIALLFVSVPALNAIPLRNAQSISKINTPEQIKDLAAPPIDDYDGTFIGGFGLMYKNETDEWAFEYYGYLAGVYKTGRALRVYGNIYNLEEEQIGTIGFISINKILVGRIQNMEEGKAPIVGFLFNNEEYFAGRIMSLFGPAPHSWGQYTPN